MLIMEKKNIQTPTRKVSINYLDYTSTSTKRLNLWNKYNWFPLQKYDFSSYQKHNFIHAFERRKSQRVDSELFKFSPHENLLPSHYT